MARQHLLANLIIGADVWFGIGMHDGFEAGMGGGIYRNTRLVNRSQSCPTDRMFSTCSIFL
jgi:hypothetical protein